MVDWSIPVVETDQRVRTTWDLDLPCWTRRGAQWLCGRLNAGRLVPSYRFEVVRSGRRWRRWEVAAFQNIVAASGFDDFDRAQESRDAAVPEEEEPTRAVEPRCRCGMRLDDRGRCPRHGAETKLQDEP